jgi:hypothetical protein
MEEEEEVEATLVEVLLEAMGQDARMVDKQTWSCKKEGMEVTMDPEVKIIVEVMEEGLPKI